MHHKTLDEITNDNDTFAARTHIWNSYSALIIRHKAMSISEVFGQMNGALARCKQRKPLDCNNKISNNNTFKIETFASEQSPPAMCL